jgi:nitrous oxide reductase accessory protein NosL
MKKGIFYIFLAALFLFAGNTLWAQDNHVHKDDIKDAPSCKFCGMNRTMFSHSRMVIEYDDGSKAATCSLHCTAIDLALSLDKKPQAIMVGDYNTKQLINAETAIWVIGGDKPGVMTKNAKWAFASKDDAVKFQNEHGGVLANFDDALDASYRDISNDTKMIREKRKMMKMKMQERQN